MERKWMRVTHKIGKMKHSKKMFVLLEAVLALAVIVLAISMFLGNNANGRERVSVIVQNSDGSQWAAFKYGLKMAAEDQGIEMFVVGTEGAMTAEEELSVIEQEIENGADAVIIQPAAGEDTKEMLEKIARRIPVLLVESDPLSDGGITEIPVIQPDNYEMGRTLAVELLEEYNGKLDGKTIGIAMETEGLEASRRRKEGFLDGLEGAGGNVRWEVSGELGQGKKGLEAQPMVDMIVALDDRSLMAAGEAAAANDLHGALVYGIGNSPEAVYYVDTGRAECLVVPDEFSVGYQSLTQIAENLRNFIQETQGSTVTHTVIRRENLFTEENQEIIYTMSQ